MKEWAQAIVSAIDRHTAAIEHLAVAIENSRPISAVFQELGRQSERVVPENSKLMKFLHKAAEEGHISAKKRARVEKFLLWLAGGSEYPQVDFNRDSIYYPSQRAIEHYAQSREELKQQGFENGVVTTPEGLAQLFSSGFLDRALIPGIGPAVLTSIKEGLKNKGYL